MLLAMELVVDTFQDRFQDVSYQGARKDTCKNAYKDTCKDTHNT